MPTQECDKGNNKNEKIKNDDDNKTSTCAAIVSNAVDATSN